jgi:procollagen-lysine,2-oxoglutarate 5-dioxygenase, invertebrate
LYFTKAYLNKEIRDAQNIRLDHTSIVFQNLNGAVPSVTLAFDADNGEAFVVNNDFKTKPVVLHGNGNSKLTLNNFGNYLAGAFDNGDCKACEEDVLTLDEDKLPTVLLAVFIESLTPFLEEFLLHIVELDYPKANIHLLVHNKVEYHQGLVDSFYKQHSGEYKSAKLIGTDDKFEEIAARELAVYVEFSDFLVER